MLTMTPALDAAGKRLQAEGFIAEMCDYLVDGCKVAERGAPGLEPLCRRAYERGLALGLTRKSSLLMFGWLVHETGEQALFAPDIERAFGAPGTDPDWAMDQIMKVMGLMAEAEA